MNSAEAIRIQDSIRGIHLNGIREVAALVLFLYRPSKLNTRQVSEFAKAGGLDISPEQLSCLGSMIQDSKWKKWIKRESVTPSRWVYWFEGDELPIHNFPKKDETPVVREAASDVLRSVSADPSLR